MTRPVVRIALGALAALVVLLAIAASGPDVRPQVERLLLAVVPAAVLVGLGAAVVRAHPVPTLTALEDTRPGTDRPPLPSELRWLAGTFSPQGGGWRGAPPVPARAPIRRLGIERLRARGLDLDRPDHAALAHRLAGDHLWAIVATPLDQPLTGIDVRHALAHLEAL